VVSSDVAPYVFPQVRRLVLKLVLEGAAGSVGAVFLLCGSLRGKQGFDSLHYGENPAYEDRKTMFRDKK
jgi:hypothetical protein